MPRTEKLSRPSIGRSAAGAAANTRDAFEHSMPMPAVADEAMKVRRERVI
jgi:hypothetical protein